MSLEGKTVVVTGGGGRGMGYTMVKMFADEGARVVTCDVNEAGLRAVEDELPDVVTLVADMGKAEDVDRLIEAAGDRIDVLCNHAAGGGGAGPILEQDEDVLLQSLAVTVVTPFRLIRRVLPGMIERGGGVIINTASVAGLRGARGGPSYTAAKFALVGLTQNIAATYGDKGIRCNAICPGPMGPEERVGQRSEQMTGLSETAQFMYSRDRGKPERARSDEVAALAVFLASDAARRINGACIPVDSGWIAY